MLSSDERRSRLESLLDRVRDNRSHGRVPVQVSPSSEPAETEEMALDEPLQFSDSLAPKTVAEVEPDVAAEAVAELEPELDMEPEPELEPEIELDPISEVVPEVAQEAVSAMTEESQSLSAEEEFFGDDSEGLSSPVEPEASGDGDELVVPEHIEEEVEQPSEPLELAVVEELVESKDELVEVEELDDSDELIEVEGLDDSEGLAVVEDLEEPVEEIKKFEASVNASADVAVIRTELKPKEWTLAAVLERAWKLGGQD